MRLARTGKVLEVPVTKTILEVLRENGLEVPSSCETGTCGTCRTKMLAGAADHRDLVLAEHERADTIMICVSRAQQRRDHARSLALDRAQINDHVARVVLAELEHRHVGMRRRDAALEHAGKPIEIELAAERAERRRGAVGAAAEARDGMAGRTEFPDQLAAVARRILVLRLRLIVVSASKAAIRDKNFIGGRSSSALALREMVARRKGFEPLTPRFEVWCSIQLSYRRRSPLVTQPHARARSRIGRSRGLHGNKPGRGGCITFDDPPDHDQQRPRQSGLRQQRGQFMDRP